MAQSFTTDDGITEYIPGTTVTTKVQANQGGIAAAGVVTLIGESDEGPDFSQEEDLDANAFGPDQIADVQNKYGTGRIVDACREIFAASNDPAIVGQVSAVKIVKTNASQKAQSAITRNGFGTYATEKARRAGLPGNLIKYRSEVSAAEQAPTVGPFAYTPHYSGSAVAFKMRINGGSAKSLSIAQKTTSANFIAALEDYARGILVQGGARQLPLTGAATFSLTAALVSGQPNQLLVTLQTGHVFNPAPAEGDTVLIPATGDYGVSHDSAIVGAANANAGSYIVLSVTNTLTSATLLLARINSSGAPALVGATGSVDAAVDDIIVQKPITISNASGMDRQSTVGMSGTFNVNSNDGTNVVMTPPANWTAQPVAGDTVSFASTFAGVQAGFYQVVSSTANTVSLTRLSNGTSGSGSGSAVVGSAITQGTQPFLVLKPVIDGLGKSMEFAGDLSSIAKDPSTQAAVTFSNSLVTSAAEYINAFTVSKGNTSQTFKSGGDIVITVGCSQASATMVVGASSILFKVGSSTIFTASYAQYKTMSDLVALINSNATFSATLTSAKFGFLSPSVLDDGTYGLSSDIAEEPGRIKEDARVWALAASQSGVAIPTMAANASGLPEVIVPDQFLAGGTKAGSTGADFVSAIDACQAIDTNFMVPLVSADSSDDISEGETESSSTYTVDSVNAYIKSHVIDMSDLKSKKNRIAIVSKNGAYADQKNAAGALSSLRVAMAFQDQKTLGGDGNIAQFQSWMGAVIAAGMQAAAGYKGIVKKFANTNGFAKPEGDFNSAVPSALEDALKAGLLIMEKVKGGGFRWVSDQTTWTVDNNFVYNSLQAVYISDLMALTMIQNFDRAVVGQSIADLSAAGILSFLDSQMFDFRRLKWISPSDDAPKGYKNASVKVVGGVIRIFFEAKLAGLVYFVPITMELSQVVQSASQ